MAKDYDSYMEGWNAAKMFFQLQTASLQRYMHHTSLLDPHNITCGMDANSDGNWVRVDDVVELFEETEQ